MQRAQLSAILELARWAPSGDNSQPWTFRILSDDSIEIIGTDHADTDVYDFDGRPTLLTLGFLLESIAIAATRFAARIEWTYEAQAPHRHRILVRVLPGPALAVDALLPYIESRSVVRGRYRRDPLTQAHIASLESALGAQLAIRWFATRAEKWQITRINAAATHIRLSIPEAFTVHQRILDWQRDQSPDGVPAKAIGLDPMTLKSMQWVMKKWERAHFMNRYAGGTVVPRVQMDVVPGLGCAAHFMVFQKRAAELPAPEQLLTTGRALQRFWLTATSLGLVMQPSLAPLCFAYYAEHGRRFTQDPRMLANAAALRRELDAVSGRVSSDELVFLGRIGKPMSTVAAARSVRKPLASLMDVADRE